MTSLVAGHLHRLALAIRRAVGDERGSLATMGAIILVVLSIMALGSVEFGRVMLARGELRDALDAATLAVARTAPEATDAERQTTGEAVLRGALAKDNAAGGLSELSFTIVNGIATGRATLTVQPIVAGLVFREGVPVRLTSQAALLGQKLEIALVLDNTWSMAWTRGTTPNQYVPNTRMTNLKSAANAFVDKLAAAAAKTHVSDAVKISVVPFNTTVKVYTPTSDDDRPTWMDRDAQSSIHDDIFLNMACVQYAGDTQPTCPNRWALFKSMNVPWKGCVEARPIPYDVRDTPPNASTPDTLFVPYFSPDERDSWAANPNEQTPGPNFGWATNVNHYLPDEVTTGTNEVRLQYLKKYRAPGNTALIPNGYGQRYGPNYECELAPLRQLTTNVADVHTTINSMTPVGNTNITTGLMWGWHTLSPNAPFTTGSRYGSGVKKIVVLMTDGDNLLHPNGSAFGNAYASTGFLNLGMPRLGIDKAMLDALLNNDARAAKRLEALDARLTELCNNMKAGDKGIVIYTVRLEPTTSNPTVANCASTPDMAFDVTDAAQLGAIFDQIADSILRLRVMPGR